MIGICQLNVFYEFEHLWHFSQAVTRNELYGYLHPSTREWKEGLISVTYRDMANNKTNKHQWILLDGDIDAEWIEVCLLAKVTCRDMCL